MADNGYISKEEAEAAKKEPLNVKPAHRSRRTASRPAISPRACAATSPSATARKRLYEGGLLIRSTLDPKMQAMARKALVDGLVRFDEARGWRGAPAEARSAGREWGLALAEVPALGDVQPWRLAVVLEVARRAGQDRPAAAGREASGQVVTDRETGSVTADGVKWTRRTVEQGAVRGRRGLSSSRWTTSRASSACARSRRSPAPSSPWTRIRAASTPWSAASPTTRASSTGRSRPCASRAPRSSRSSTRRRSTTAIRPRARCSMRPSCSIWARARPPGRRRTTTASPAGLRTLRYGVEHSKNLMTVRLANEVGMPAISEYARRFGVYDDLLPVLSMSLGAGETTVMRMTAAYSMFVNGGTPHQADPDRPHPGPQRPDHLPPRRPQMRRLRRGEVGRRRSRPSSPTTASR